MLAIISNLSVFPIRITPCPYLGYGSVYYFNSETHRMHQDYLDHSLSRLLNECLSLY
ncbi:hypothetical protein D3C81_1675090 [compost metagenome]